MSVILNGTTGITTPGLINTGTETIVNLTTTGNTILGDASTDTLNVGNGGLVKDASGNVGIGSSSITGIGANVTTLKIAGRNTTNAGGIQLYSSDDTTVKARTWAETGGWYFDLQTAQPMIFNTSGTERMRLDSSGNLGLGVTPSAWYTATGFKALQFEAGALSSFSTTNFIMRQNAYAASGTATETYVNNGFASYYIQTAGSHGWATAPSGTAGNAITFTQAMTLDASGNLGIGKSSPTLKLNVAQGAKATTAAAITTGGFETADATNPFGLYFRQKTDATAANRWTGIQSYDNGVNPSNLVLQDLGGTVLVGTTGNATVGGIAILPNADNSLVRIGHSSASGNTAYYMNYYWNGNIVGSIQQSGTTGVTYVTTSDYRLKENVQPLTGALDRVARLKPVTYTWKNTDGEVGEGFIAHELQEVCPLATAGEKDAVNEDGSIKPQGIDTSYLVATLTAAIQEQQAMIDELKAKVAALEAA